MYSGRSLIVYSRLSLSSIAFGQLLNDTNNSESSVQWNVANSDKLENGVFVK